jgi:hypothetical protein
MWGGEGGDANRTAREEEVVGATGSKSRNLHEINRNDDEDQGGKGGSRSDRSTDLIPLCQEDHEQQRFKGNSR